MSITTLPVVADFGGTKANEYAEVDSGKQLAAAAYNALTGRMVDAFAAIGLDDGTTSGSLREGLQTTQTVTASPATVSARFIVLDDDTHTSGAPGSLVMPPITEGAWHVIATPYEDVHYLVTKAPGDPVGTGPDLTIDSSFIRQQTIVLVAVERDGILRWQGDSTGYYLAGLLTAYLATATQVQALERPYSDARTHTETTAAYTWSSGLTIKRLVIDRNASKPTITLDESDWEDGTTCRLDVLDSGGFGVEVAVGGGAVLNGQTAGTGYVTLPGSTNGFDGMPPSYEVTRIDGGWTIRSMVDVADGVVDAFVDISGRVDALEVTGRQVITTATATILPGTRVVYIDHAAARTDLTLPATPFEPFTIKKRATSGGFGVRLIPDDAADAIQGLAAGTNFDIGWMTTNASTTTARPAAFVSSSAVNVVDVA